MTHTPSRREGRAKAGKKEKRRADEREDRGRYVWKGEGKE
jgi:hypothetical protein